MTENKGAQDRSTRKDYTRKIWFKSNTKYPEECSRKKRKILKHIPANGKLTWPPIIFSNNSIKSKLY